MERLLKSKIIAQLPTSCSKVVNESEKKSVCGGLLVKNGITKYGKQRFLCRKCRTTRVAEPKQYNYRDLFNQQIIQLTKEGLGIRSVARVIGIAPSTVIRKILDVAEKINSPEIPEILGRIQVDELHTFVQL